MANTKNSQAAKIRQQIIAWLQDDQQAEVVSAEKFPGIRGIRAVKLRQMLGDLGYKSSVVMGAISAAPSIDERIKKAAVKPREVYYYFDAGETDSAATSSVAATPATAASPAVTVAPTTARFSQPAPGLAGTPAFAQVVTTNQHLSQAIDDLLAAAERQRPLSDLELNFLTDFAAQVAKQGELLQNFATQSKIDHLRRG
ncbi:MAG: hypothetical protein LKH74_03765 [Levilactobacillus sp.]|jgi:hypothetical protein|uniref:Uncharacterized protein n=1 Tax=Levilactobacillus suantsaiihabitans TaxID=2487722 RepID=A0A4Z0J6C3_9LACO|nr:MULTISPECIES: hypothetical protein [Levilactobacillus]MCI1553018.1 hypothetical protein [Levilactobacillus sp.]MCI1598159.1 hypothetical protein [Levilactobacillus sp.]MCI1605022.1 hypothetical protein [Levilactobacillus sp.]TGD18027.1 hypothetical protein EGT51_10110 [Levilactobacillus suantsaiihabitans]